jgi:predicted CXXCH cytochrome family protein
MNNKQILLLVVVLLGITIWNIPNTTSIFYNQHSFYNGSAPCQKCHQDIQNILYDNQTPYIKHEEIGCRGCHTRDGNTSHSASIKSCTDCHNSNDHHPTYYNFSNCKECHTSHGGRIENFTKQDSGLLCLKCHIIRRG